MTAARSPAPATARRRRHLRGWLALCCILATGSAAATPVLRIDGRLDEAAWGGAQRFDDFVVTEPYTLDPPAHPTAVRVLSTPAGIAIGFEMQQPAGVPRQRDRTPRDADIPGDRVNVFIDFDADGEVGYNFTVGLSGAVQDATITNEVVFSNDWDADWQSAVQETADGWSVEMLLPWTIAAMRDSTAPRRSIALMFDRVLGHRAERSGSPAASFTRPRFVSEFRRIEIDQYQLSILEWFPYATAQHDLIARGSSGKAGLDVFWKPSGEFQLTAALNPDFGQVEADELVVNFDAVETFFSDKRPFFTENQSLFDLRTPDSGQLIYTRRIGGPRDDDSGLAADIDAAIKLNGSARGLGYGMLAAIESDHADDVGSLYYAHRVVRPDPVLSLGYLGTWTDRPLLERTALVNAVDATWRPNAHAQLSGQLIASDTEQQRDGEHGRGAWLRLDLTPSTALRHELELTHFDAALDFNDIGFQRRNSLNEAEWTTQYQQSGFGEDHLLRGISWYIEGQYRSNDRGDRLPVVLIPELTLQYRDGAQTFASLQVETAGYDDLISRGNGLVRVAPEWSLFIEHETARIGRWAFEFAINPYEAALDDDGWYVEGGAQWFASEQFAIGAELGWLRSDDWLIWERDRLFGVYARTQVTAEIDANWFPAERHELRLKLQWLAIDADEPEAFAIGANARLQPADFALQPFAINNFGIQLRYRWTFRPQSDLFVVYSRGGFSEAFGGQPGITDLVQDAFSLRDADQVLVKLRYRL